MKRIGNIYGKIISIENLELADFRARKGKSHQYGIRLHDKSREANISILHSMLTTQTYRTSPYVTFKIFEPKEREVFRLPYFPDRIAHHAVMNILKPIFVAHFTADTYSCIEGRGILGAANAVKQALRDEAGTKYCLQIDIRKFYPSINHQILKNLLRRKFKDERLMFLLEEVIDSAPGLPIGNYLSQYFANFYLSGFDHWLKEKMGVKYYFRYLDDMVFFAPDKPSLHKLLSDMRTYLSDKLKLEIKGNYQVFPVENHGIDFVGYVFRHGYTLLRKSIKKSFARKIAKRPRMASIVSYYGWAKHCNSNNLLKTLLNEKVRRISNYHHQKSLRRRKDKVG